MLREEIAAEINFVNDIGVARAKDEGGRMKNKPTGIKRGTSPAKRRSDTLPVKRMDFTALVSAIRQVHDHCAAQPSRAVNVRLTMRNWVIGWYIREYEQIGADRAKYGEQLLIHLADALSATGSGDMSARSLWLYRQFFTTYPTIWQSLTAKSSSAPARTSIWQSLIAKSPSLRTFAGPDESGALPQLRNRRFPNSGQTQTCWLNGYPLRISRN